MMRLLRVPVALVLSLSLPSVAMAQHPIVAAPEDMSDDEKIEKAKSLYVQAEGLAKEDNWEAAVVLYEQAYYLVPGKHGFAHKVGIAAWKVLDCDKSYDYLNHFLEYNGDPEKYADKIAEAEGILAEIEAAQCRTAAEPEPEPEPVAVVEEENPFEQAAEEDNPRDKDKKKGGNGLLAGGAVLITFGAIGLGLGGAGAGIASGAGSALDDLSSTNTLTGYPSGDYACRDAGTDCPTQLESRLGLGKALSYAGFIGGGVLLAAGIGLVVVHVSKKKKTASASAKANSGVELTSIGPALLPGGGGAAATLRF